MSSLVKDGVFERIRIFDYQAVCFKSSQTNNAANSLLTVSTFNCNNNIIKSTMPVKEKADVFHYIYSLTILFKEFLK